MTVNGIVQMASSTHRASSSSSMTTAQVTPDRLLNSTDGWRNGKKNTLMKINGFLCCWLDGARRP